MATAKKRTNSTIILPSGFYGLGGVAARPIAVRLPGASTWLKCLTSGRVTVLKPSLNLFGDFLEISAARGQAFADLLVFAMASDLTRVFSYMFSAPACHGNYVDCGLAPSSFHEDYGHRTSNLGVAAATKGFNTGVKFAMSNFDMLLSRE